ncbi:peptidoglycan hydrolase-like protein with peptidoglycan-binding domain [Nocardioides salarius]|uniref:Peptidoglycan hydrolase-like protein with peptidoglycan-binding domain n=1 Tax=Nocardioides salarius TaxID=374513 RepID=A0ABS2MCA1_9ACTN|nr:L,D-transpeptidase family protein [Nocardioides salarius]MBM7508799.1 peptidoglycan hydrolase-like protein with peptidoglycan-binding domain [Nocardioides salarius]
MTNPTRLAILVALLLLLPATAYGAGLAQERWMGGAEPSTQGAATAADPAPSRGATFERPVRPARPARQPVAPAPAPIEPAMVPGPTLLGPGAEGEEVRDLQARLAQIGWFSAGVTGFYGDVTVASVRGFQAKREVPVTGDVDRRTLDRLLAMTREPSTDELHPERVVAPAPSAALDPRCLVGTALCVDKTTATLSFVVDGQVRTTLDARFGGASTPTREGLFTVQRMSRDHVSSLYDTSMPFAMFFSGGQAVHYSPDFAAVGYAGASHGCVNIRDHAAIAAIYDQVSIGDRVVVHRS